MSRVLFVIPHYYHYSAGSNLASETEPADVRAGRVARTITSLHETFGRSLTVFPGYRSADTDGNSVDIALVTTPTDHLVAELGDIAKLVDHVIVDEPPLNLGFVAHRVLAGARGRYERFAYVEDDLVIHDPLFFAKQDWFTTTFGSQSLLLPARYESSGGIKVHPDGPLPASETACMRQPPGPERLEGSWFGVDLSFERPSNPHSACFFVGAEQMERLAAHPRFGIPHDTFENREIETASTFSVVETFSVYKTASPLTDFLEVEHQSSGYLDKWVAPDPMHVAAATVHAAEVRADEAGYYAGWAEKRAVDAGHRLHEAKVRLKAAGDRAIDAETRASEAEARASEAEARAHREQVRAEDAEKELSEIRGSTSWRITAPIRHFVGRSPRRK